MNRGKLVIAFIFGLSAVMGGYAWWHHYTQGRQCVVLWGAETGEAIRYAPQVEVMRLDVAGAPDAETIQIQDQPLKIVARKDITNTPGLVHARQALIEDASFLWKADLAGPSNWQYLLRFTDGDKQVSVAFDCDQGRVRLVGTDRQAALKPHLTAGYQSRLPIWLGADANSSQPVAPATADTP
ncbi:MAG: hypothetical protein ABI614_09780 [Planctomycetota bacterium]